MEGNKKINDTLRYMANNDISANMVNISNFDNFCGDSIWWDMINDMTQIDIKYGNDR